MSVCGWECAPGSLSTRQVAQGGGDASDLEPAGRGGGGVLERLREASRAAEASVRDLDAPGVSDGAEHGPASTHENRTTELMLEHLTDQGVAGRLDLVLVDRGVTAAAAGTLGRRHALEVRLVGWDDKQARRAHRPAARSRRQPRCARRPWRGRRGRRGRGR